MRGTHLRKRAVLDFADTCNRPRKVHGVRSVGLIHASKDSEPVALNQAGCVRAAVRLNARHKYSRNGKFRRGEPQLTRPLQKRRERIFVEEAARHLGKTWDLSDDREHPDFIIVENGQRFGLEVTQIFIGSQGGAGSSFKAVEGKTQRTVNGLQRQYEAVPLTVKFVGNMEADNLATVIPALLAQDLPSKPLCYHFV
jgi:hypothetical protein